MNDWSLPKVFDRMVLSRKVWSAWILFGTRNSPNDRSCWFESCGKLRRAETVKLVGSFSPRSVDMDEGMLAENLCEPVEHWCLGLGRGWASDVNVEGCKCGIRTRVEAVQRRG